MPETNDDAFTRSSHQPSRSHSGLTQAAHWPTRPITRHLAAEISTGPTPWYAGSPVPGGRRQANRRPIQVQGKTSARRNPARAYVSDRHGRRVKWSRSGSRRRHGGNGGASAGRRVGFTADEILPHCDRESGRRRKAAAGLYRPPRTLWPTRCNRTIAAGCR